MGRWNGVGGKLDVNESPLDCIIRETQEETGLLLPQYIPRGVLTWIKDGEDKGGAYLFTASVTAQVFEEYVTPKVYCHEGILDWKKMDWVLHEENTGIVDNVKIMLKHIFTSVEEDMFVATYSGKQLLGVDYIQK